MTWPSAATKVHLDQATDDPKQARVELADLVDQFNLLQAHVSALSQTLLALTTAATWRSNIDAQQLINSLAAETSPAVGDLVGLRDISAGADRKMTLANMLAVTNALTEETSVDAGADFVALWDNSAAAMRKVKPQNLSGIDRQTAVATTSGSTAAFANVKSGADRITMMLSGVSMSTTAHLLIQVGDAGGYDTTGYLSGAVRTAPPLQSTAGFLITESSAATDAFYGVVILTRQDGNTWVSNGNLYDGNADVHVSSGARTLDSELDSIRLTLNTGNFDAGSVNIFVE